MGLLALSTTSVAHCQAPFWSSARRCPIGAPARELPPEG